MIKNKEIIKYIVMESSSSKSVAIKVKYTKPEKVEIKAFDFEDLIIEHYKKYPRTAAMVEKPKLVEALLNPFKMFYLVPFALFGVKLNTILSQKWKDYLKLWIYITIMFIPTIILVILPFLDVTQEVDGVTKNIWPDVLLSVAVPLLIGILLSLFYLKYTHDGFLALTMEKRVEWIEKPVREYYEKYYNKKLPKNPLIFLLSLGAGIAFNIPMIQFAYAKDIAVAKIAGILSCIFSPVLYYVFFVATYFLILNTRIYSRILNEIKKRIVEYLDAYGTLLTRENYDIIWALGDKWSRGRAITQVENIPVAGILSALVTTIATLMGSINELIYGLFGKMPELGFNIGTLIDSTQPWSVMVVIIAVLVALILFAIVFLPLYFFSIKVKKFKIKALIELDNYIFANVVEFETLYAEKAKQETLTMFQLREYIASMRTLPISGNKIFRTVLAVILWFLNMRRIFRAVAGVGS
ncbi:MAG: hypothetical protein ACTSX6_11000 [Candidatus Heimdallarchaeaceae archaeon]